MKKYCCISGIDLRTLTSKATGHASKSLTAASHRSLNTPVQLPGVTTGAMRKDWVELQQYQSVIMIYEHDHDIVSASPGNGAVNCALCQKPVRNQPEGQGRQFVYGSGKGLDLMMPFSGQVI